MAALLESHVAGHRVTHRNSEKPLSQAREAMGANTREFDYYAELRARMQGEGGGGIADIYWCGRAACETRIREETRATCRAIPLGQSAAGGRCIVCGEAATERAFFAKAY